MELFLFLAENFVHQAIVNIETKGEFTVALSGGNTPKLLFDYLTKKELNQKKIPWEQIKFFFGDERYLAPDNPENNYHMAYEHLFSKVPVLKEHIYPIPTHLSDPKEAARDYETTLRKVFHLKENELPKFDLVYLGLGLDAHTASLLPSSELVIRYVRSHLEREDLINPPGLDEGKLTASEMKNFTTKKNPDANSDANTNASTSETQNFPMVAALFAPLQGIYRITLTPPIINNAKMILFIVTGANKASAVSAVLEGPRKPELYPAQLIHCLHDKTMWFLDQAAASQLRFVNEKK